MPKFEDLPVHVYTDTAGNEYRLKVIHDSPTLLIGITDHEILVHQPGRNGGAFEHHPYDPAQAFTVALGILGHEEPRASITGQINLIATATIVMAQKFLFK